MYTYGIVYIVYTAVICTILIFLFPTQVTRHPEVLAKIQAELDRINPDRSVPFDVSHISQLDYTLNAIKEAMRMWPAIASGIHTLCHITYIPP